MGREKSPWLALFIAVEKCIKIRVFDHKKRGKNPIFCYSQAEKSHMMYLYIFSWGNNTINFALKTAQVKGFGAVVTHTKRKQADTCS
jgi:hypothetical protein